MCIIVLTGTSEGLAGPRAFLMEFVGVVIPNDLTGSILVEIIHCDEGGNVEQVARTSK